MRKVEVETRAIHHRFRSRLGIDGVVKPSEPNVVHRQTVAAHGVEARNVRKPNSSHQARLVVRRFRQGVAHSNDPHGIGANPVLLPVGDHRASTAICYEVIFPA